MKIYTVLTFLIFCFSNTALSNDKFNFDFDYAYFRAENSKVYLEFYYAFNQEELKFIKSINGFEAGGKIIMDVYSNYSGKNIIMKDFNIPLSIKDTAGYNFHSKLTGQINLLLDTGGYVLKLKACDINDTSKSFLLTEDIVLKPIESNSVNSSSIQLATNIMKSSDENHIFYKNTLEVTPNPSLLFGNNISKVYYYIELYNLRTDLLSDKYSIDVIITDSDGKDIISERKNYNIKVESKVEYGAIDIKNIPTGKYSLFIKIINDQNQEILKNSKIFYVLNSSIIADNNIGSDLENRYIVSEYPNLTEKQVNEDFEKSIYIMTEKNRKQYENLKDLEMKRKFMFSFWNALDPIPATPESEFKKDYYEKIEYANKNFKHDREGWKTDRGRIYCLYGKYDDIERFPYEGSTRAYEIWTYNYLQGGVIFVFIDASGGYGDYVLVHSTAQNEIHNDNWRDKLNIK